MTIRNLAISDRIDDFIAAFNLGLRDHHMLERDASGCIAARYFNSRLSSVFQPIREAATGRVVGHEGLIRCFGGSQDALTSPWGVFALVGLERDLVDLDRLCRTLHMLNYFGQSAAGASLFLNIDLRLLTAVQRGSGRAFEERLRRVGLKPCSIVIEFPAAALSRQELLLQAVADYRSRGYRVAVICPGLARDWPAALWQARPDIVKVPVSAQPDAATLGEVVRVIHDNGVTALAERLETAEQEAHASTAGFDLLQGYRIGLPAVGIDSRSEQKGGASRHYSDVPIRSRQAEGQQEGERSDSHRVLIVPGLHGSGPGHWQSLWQDEHPEYGRVVQDDWEVPDLDRWAGRLDRAIKERAGPVVLVAHSFGCLAAVRRAALDAHGIAGALLVAPANPDKFDAVWMLPTRRLPFPVTVVGSENDPWMSLVSAKWWAERWGGRFVNLGAAGHINGESGYGRWPEGERLLESLVGKSPRRETGAVHAHGAIAF